jgi:hypothetical protein
VAEELGPLWLTALLLRVPEAFECYISLHSARSACGLTVLGRADLRCQGPFGLVARLVGRESGKEIEQKTDREGEKKQIEEGEGEREGEKKGSREGDYQVCTFITCNPPHVDLLRPLSLASFGRSSTRNGCTATKGFLSLSLSLSLSSSPLSLSPPSLSLGREEEEEAKVDSCVLRCLRPSYFDLRETAREVNEAHAIVYAREQGKEIEQEGDCERGRERERDEREGEIDWDPRENGKRKRLWDVDREREGKRS